jgi:hypothetical protein
MPLHRRLCAYRSLSSTLLRRPPRMSPSDVAGAPYQPKTRTSQKLAHEMGTDVTAVTVILR